MCFRMSRLVGGKEVDVSSAGSPISSDSFILELQGFLERVFESTKQVEMKKSGVRREALRLMRFQANKTGSKNSQIKFQETESRVRENWGK